MKVGNTSILWRRILNFAMSLQEEESPIHSLSDTFELVATRVYEEERRLQNLYLQNSILIPKKSKKTPCSLPIHKEAMKFFKKEKNDLSLTFEKYIRERRENQTSTEATLQQCAQFISYLEMTLQNKDLSVPQLLNTVVLHHSLLFHQHFQFLRDHGLKCSTILLRLNAIYHLIQWLRMTRSEHFHEYSQILDRLIIDRSRYNAITSNLQKKKTIENLIEMREWVEGGITSLQDIMFNSWPYFDALVSYSKYQTLTSRQYSWILGYTLASLWVFGVNARAKCIESMRLKDFKDIEQNTFHLSNNFKTSSTFGYQIVSATDVLKIYVKHIRKQVIEEDIDSDDATLFPTYKKTPLARGEASKKINSIFKKYGYDLTVTKLRDMISTHVEMLYSTGKISITGEDLIVFISFHVDYQQFVTVGQTHSLATHKRYYVVQEMNKKRKFEEGKEIQELYQAHMHQHSLPVASIESNPHPPPSPFQTSIDPTFVQDINETYDFGSSRSDLNKKGSRFEWTQDEIACLQSYILNVEPNLCENERKNKYSACLAYLKRADPSIQQYFHPHHCENSSRIKTGYEVALKKMGNRIMPN